MNPSVSTIQMYKDCGLKYKLHHIVGLRKIEDESGEHHLVFGKAMHRAMEIVYTTMLEGKKVTLRTVEQAKQAFTVVYPRQLDPNDNAKNQQAAFDAIDELVALYVGEDQRRWRVVSVEAPDIYDDGYIVHLDLVMENLVHGGFYGRDWKFTKKPLRDRYNSFWNQFEPNSQIRRYSDYIASKYGSCEGFYVHATQFGYRNRKSINGPAGQFRVHEAQLFNVNEDKIAIERASTVYWLKRIEQSIADNEWGTDTSGCQWCQFKLPCSSGWTWERDRDLFLNRFILVCNALTDTLRACQLEPGHQGNHSEDKPLTGEMEIEVEI